ncbi:MAG: hypothetical protein FJ276_01360 [Planctomycetes bacterium]|nr:hypothetical protein [Planctomycetota bacterium]
MLQWFFPRAPLEPVEKAWVETRMQWIAEQLGASRLLNAKVVVPTPEFFADCTAGTPEAAGSLMARLGGLMGLDPRNLNLEVCCEEHVPEVVGVHDAEVIRVARQQLADPPALAATLVHALGYRVLPHVGNTASNERDREWIVDLLSVFLGLGVFIANASVHASLSEAVSHCWCSLRKQPYLPARMLGYAMALFTFARGETSPHWTDSLRLDALAAFRHGQTYLRRTADSLFTADSARQPPRAKTLDELLALLRTGSPSARVAALWELRDPAHARDAVEIVTQRLHDRHEAIRAEAARTLAVYGPAAGIAVPTLVDLLEDAKFSVRCAAAAALGTLGMDARNVVPQLAILLDDADREVVRYAALAVKQFADQAIPAVPHVLGAVRSAMIRCDHALLDTLLATLYALDPDPTQRILEFFAEDPELREQAVHLIVDSLDENNLA